MSALTLRGRLYSATDIEQKSPTFSLRTFILETTSVVAGNEYKNYAKFQLVNNNTALIESFQPGQEVVVSFDVRGQLWNDTCITNLNAFRIELATQQASAPANGQWNQPAQQAPAAAPAAGPAPQSWGAQQANGQTSAPPPAQNWGSQPAAPATGPAPQTWGQQPAQGPPATGDGKMPF